MRLSWIFGFVLLVLLVYGALPADALNAGTGKGALVLPVVRRDPTSTPTPTPTPTPVPVVHIQYRAFVQNQGWLPWQDEGGQAGTTGQSLALQAFEMKLKDPAPPGVGIRYRAHVSNVGWTDWQTSGGTPNCCGYPVEAIEVGLTNAPPNTSIAVEPYVADWAWLGYVRDNWIAGTTSQGRRMEAFHAYIRTDRPEPAAIHVAYNGFVEGSTDYSGWQRNGDTIGTTGQSKRLEKFRAVLYNYPEGMDLQYRCYREKDNVWNDFIGSGAECGDVGYAIWALEMRLVNAYQGSVLSYSGHFAIRGWLSYASDNPSTSSVIGNPSDRYRLEALQINVGNAVAVRNPATAPIGAPTAKR